MKLKLLITLLSFVLVLNAQNQANYDESKIPDYTLPDPLVLLSGQKVKTSEIWEQERRPEILSLFEEQVYGKIPGELDITSYEILEESQDAFNGKAIRKQVKLTFEKQDKKLDVNLLVCLPKNVKKAPLFLAYNFGGNQTVVDDKEVLVSEVWLQKQANAKDENKLEPEQSRGKGKSRWPVEKIIDAGYGLATMYYEEIDPDKNDFSDGIHPFFYTENQTRPADNEWGAISAWAWGLTKAMDYLEKDEAVDKSKIIVMGHSRLGKTALWAGAQDQRFAMVISNNSGCGGASLSRRRIGESISEMNKNFPHWCCKNFDSYNNNEDALPVDQHLLIALIAPRPIYIASAEEDQWADPKGEFLSALNATPVYHLYGKKGLETDIFPDVNQPIQHTIGYHVRTGKHDVTEYDWEQFIKFADLNLK